MKRSRQTDLNYLFRRQQIERSRAKTASSRAARIAHEELAAAYEEQINRATADGFILPANSPAPKQHNL
ncbi:MAG: hypothetical protein ABI770_02335 [Sphingomicrobium sp.]